jgi:hypothetical protein
VLSLWGEQVLFDYAIAAPVFFHRKTHNALASPAAFRYEFAPSSKIPLWGQFSTGQVLNRAGFKPAPQPVTIEERVLFTMIGNHHD